MKRARVLFVDDEPRILRAIERELRAYSDRFELEFAGSGAEAITKMKAAPPDVLVTDMVMKGVDGAALLTYARDSHPDTVRIVLSAHREHEHASRSVSYAHQRLLKPWSADALAQTLIRAVSLRALIGDDLIRRAVSHVAALPTPLAVYGKLSAVLDSPRASFANVAEVIASDMAMSAKILQLANSALIGAGRKVTQICDAVRLVGIGPIRQYLLSPYMNVFEILGEGTNAERFAHLGEHANLTAHIAAALCRDEEQRGRAFVTALLHDIGGLVLLTRAPEVMAQLAAEAAAKDCPVHALELRHFGVTHADVGAYLLGLWGLPEEICDAVASHHAEGSDGSELSLILRVAEWTAREHEARTARAISRTDLLVTDHDPALLAALSSAKDIPRLLALARTFRA